MSIAGWYLALQGINTAANVGNKLLGIGGSREPAAVDPAKYFDKIVPSRGALGAMRHQAMINAQDATRGTEARIRQMSSAGRLPAGATFSALSELGRKRAQGVASIEPQLAEHQRRGWLDYIDLKNRYQQAKVAADERNRGRYDLSGDVGNLTQALFLYKSGLLGNGPQTYDVGNIPFAG